MKRLEAGELHSLKVAELGLAATGAGLASPEALAAALRRAASFSCPCTPSSLIRSVVLPLDGLVESLDVAREKADELLEAILLHGDLLEYRAVDQGRGVLLYTAPPSFVPLRSGSVALLGVATDQTAVIPADLQRRVQSRGVFRTLEPVNGEDLRTILLELGLVEMSERDWIRAPKPVTATAHLAEVSRLLEAASPVSEVPGLTILDSSEAVTYYRGRWKQPKTQSGRFVGRRAQAYGADLWCYLELNGGKPGRLIDLPLRQSRARGCDDAWRLQLAIDSVRGAAQEFRVTDVEEGRRMFEFFSPVPMWARRKWEVIGMQLEKRGCLFAYTFAAGDADQESRYCREELWMKEVKA